MKYVQVGVQSLRGPDGKFYPSTPIYREVPDEVAKEISASEKKMLDDGALSIAQAMKRYRDAFKSEF